MAAKKKKSFEWTAESSRPHEVVVTMRLRANSFEEVEGYLKDSVIYHAEDYGILAVTVKAEEV